MNSLFYIKHIGEKWIAEVTEIEPDEHRNGWIRYTVIYNPLGFDNIGGGISAAYVFMSGLFDYGKDVELLKTNKS